ncbi:MAG: M48 family metalloprotease [Planctomycetota bacterium]
MSRSGVGLARGVVGRLARCAVVLTLGVALVGCESMPRIPIPTLVDLSEREVVEIANQQAPQMTQQFGGEVPSQLVRAYVDARGRELAAVSRRPNLPWSFKVLNNNAVNAFAMPGGHVFITRGLLVQLKNEAELMGVLGHEIGHVTLNHGESRMEKAATMELGVKVLTQMINKETDDELVRQLGQYGAQIASTMVQLQHSRQDETDADAKGMDLPAKLGYSPAGIMGVLEVLSRISGGSKSDLFKSHPNPERRIADVKKTLDEKYPNWQAATGPYHRFEPNRYQQNILKQLVSLPPAPDVALVIPEGAICTLVPVAGRKAACDCSH